MRSGLKILDMNLISSNDTGWKYVASHISIISILNRHPKPDGRNQRGAALCDGEVCQLYWE